MKLITYETYYLCQGFTNVLENSLKKKKWLQFYPWRCSSSTGDLTMSVWFSCQWEG